MISISRGTQTYTFLPTFVNFLTLVEVFLSMFLAFLHCFSYSLSILSHSSRCLSSFSSEITVLINFSLSSFIFLNSFMASFTNGASIKKSFPFCIVSSIHFASGILGIETVPVWYCSPSPLELWSSLPPDTFIPCSLAFSNRNLLIQLVVLFSLYIILVYFLYYHSYKISSFHFNNGYYYFSYFMLMVSSLGIIAHL